MAIFVACGALLFIAQYMQLVLGLAALEAGLWMLPPAAAFIAGSMLARCSCAWRAPPTSSWPGYCWAAFGLTIVTQVPPAAG